MNTFCLCGCDVSGGGDDHIKDHCIYEGWHNKVVLMFAKDVAIFLMMLSGGLLMSRFTDESTVIFHDLVLSLAFQFPHCRANQRIFAIGDFAGWLNTEPDSCVWRVTAN